MRHARDKNIETITVEFTALKKKFRFQKVLLHQKIRLKISGGVFRAIFDLQPNLVVNILNFEPFCHAHDRYGRNC